MFLQNYCESQVFCDGHGPLIFSYEMIESIFQQKNPHQQANGNIAGGVNFQLL